MPLKMKMKNESQFNYSDFNWMLFHGLQSRILSE